MTLEQAQASIRRMLKKVRPTTQYAAGRQYGTHKPGPLEFPVPELALFVLRNILGLEEYGPEEKMRWGVCFEYEGACFGVELRKLGFTTIFEQNHGPGDPLYRECFGKLRKAILIAEAYLDHIAREQAARGAVSIQNKYHYLDERYRFFRTRAKEHYALPPPPPIVHTRNAAGGPTSSTVYPFARVQEGGFLAGSMLESYFSRTEHLFVLALPFTSFDPSGGSLLKFIGDQWSDKMRTLFDIKSEDAAKNFHDKLKRVRETLRNPLAHGGFESGIGSLYFHLDNIGALSARMTRKHDGFHFLFSPIVDASYVELCQLLDAFDEFLMRGKLRYGVRWARSGLDVAYDEESRREYHAAMQSDQSFEELIERTSYRAGYHDNFEY